MVPASGISTIATTTVTATLLVLATTAGITTVSAIAGVDSDDDCAAAFDLDGPRLYLPASEDATVEGTRDPGSGTDMSVVVAFDGETSPRIVRNDSVVVDDHGTWRATVDLSGVEEGRVFVATLQRDGDVVESVWGEVGNATATVTVEDQRVTTTGTTLVVRRVHLDLGGFVAIHEGDPSGPIVGVSDFLGPGTHGNVTVELDASFAAPSTLVAIPHRDSDCDETFGFIYGEYSDGPYVENTTPLRPVTDVASVTFSTPTLSPTRTAMPSPSPTPTPTARDTLTATPTGTTTTGPGFGIGPTLVALVGGGFLLRRIR